MKCLGKIFLIFLSVCLAWSNEPHFVKDLKTESFGDGDSSGQTRYQWQGLTFFDHREDARGSNVWVSDGTASGTKMLIDVSDNGSWHSLWQSNDAFVVFRSSSYFYVTDGTPEGTHNLGDFLTDEVEITATHAFFIRGSQLFTTDGSGAEPTILYGGDQRYVSSIYTIGASSEHVYFYDRIRRLMGVSDGTLAGTSTYAPPFLQSEAEFIGADLSGNRSLVHFSHFQSYGPEVLMSRDAQGQWTMLQVDVSPIRTSEVINGRIFFTGIEVSTRGVWSSDGTIGGTHHLFSGAQDYHFLAPWRDGYVIRVRDDEPHSTYYGLYYSDGTPDGTVRLNGEDEPGFSDVWVHGSGLFYRSYLNPLQQLWYVTADGRNLIYEGEVSILGISETGICYFTVFDSEEGSQLYSTDGTTSGTLHLADISAGNAQINSSFFQTNGARVAIGLDNDFIWTSTGTPASTEVWLEGTYAWGLANGNWIILDSRNYSTRLSYLTDGPAANIQPLPVPINGNATQAANQLIYFGHSSDWGVELSATDGTVAGTQQLGNFSEPRTADSYFRDLINHDGKLFALTFEADPNWGIYNIASSDGTTENTQILFQGNNTRALFSNEGKLWFGGLVSGNYALSFYENGEITSLALSQLTSTSRAFGAANGKLFFNSGDRFYATDGTESGTTQVGNIGLNSESLTINDKVFFDTGIGSNRTIQCSDGTLANTQTIFTGHLASELVSVDDTILFFVKQSDYDVSPWISDGTPAGTRRLKDLTSISPMSGLPVAANHDGTAYFTLRNTQLWRTDLTEANTRMVIDLAEYGNTQEIVQIYPMNDYILILANSSSRTQLWRSRGEANNTYLLREFHTVTDGENAAIVGDRLYFAGSESTTGKELWSSDGTGPGTYRVSDLMPGPPSSEPADFTVVGGQLFYSAQHPEYGRELFSLCNTPPTDITAPISVCPGETGLAASVADAGSTASYTWSITNGHILTEDGPSITWEPDGAGDVTLHVTIDLLGGCTGTGQLIIPMTTLAPNPVAVISGPDNVCAYAREVIYETPDLGPGITYTWTVPEGATILTGANSPRIAVDFANGIGDVSVTAANACGASTPTSLTVAHQTLSAFADAGPDLATCTGDLQLTANGNYGDGTWSVHLGQGGQFADNRDPHTSFQGQPGENYVLKWTYTAGACADSFDLLHVAVTDPPDATIASTSSCPGGLLNQVHVADAGDATYQWDLDGATIISGAGTPQITYERTDSIVTITATVTAQGDGCDTTHSVVIPETATMPISLWRDPNTYRVDRDTDDNGRIDLTDYIHYINTCSAQP